MAAVQQSGMPQQQGGMGAGILPAGMTKESVQAMYKEYQQMKANGTPDNDPKMMKTRAILQQIQAKTEQLKRMQAMKQQMQMKQAQQQGPMQQNGSPAQPQMNGAASGMNMDAAQSQQPSNGATPASSQAMPQPSSSQSQMFGGNDQASFSKDQIMTLRAQMQAFSHLQKNVPIPQQLADRLFPSKQEQRSSSMGESVATAGKVLDDASQTPAQTASEENGRPRHRFETFTDPHSLMLKHISYADHTQRANRSMIPIDL